MGPPAPVRMTTLPLRDSSRSDADDDTLDLGVMLHGLDAALATESAALAAAKRRGHRTAGVIVNEDLAGLDFSSHAQGAVDVGSPDSGRQSEFGVVGQPDGL